MALRRANIKSPFEVVEYNPYFGEALVGKEEGFMVKARIESRN